MTLKTRSEQLALTVTYILLQQQLIKNFRYKTSQASLIMILDKNTLLNSSHNVILTFGAMTMLILGRKRN